MAIQKLFTSRANKTNGSTFVGEKGHLFYDETTGELRLSDGHTAGGLPILVASTTANLGDLYVVGPTISTVNPNEDLNLDSNGTGNVNIIGSLRIFTDTGYYSTTPVLSASQTGNVAINGNLTTNGDTYLVGTTTFVGTTVHQGSITATGNLTTTGNLITNGPSYFNGPTNFVGAEVNTGNVTVNGNLMVNGPSYFVGNVAEIGNLTVTGNAVNNGFSIFNGNVTTTGNLNIVGNLYQTGNNVITGSLTQYGTTTMVVSTASSTQGAVEITGDPTGLSQTPVNTGVMLHVTGQSGQVGRIYNDSIANYALYVGRRFEGTMALPTGVQGNVDILRVAGTPYTSAGWANIGPARISFVTNEIQTGTNQGGRIEFWTTANASGPAYSTVSRTATIDPALGITTIGLTSSDGIVASGNVTVGNTVVYSTATGDAGSVTQTGTKATAVTSNGRSGRIVMNGASLAGQTSVTFTVNNNYIKNVSDVPIVSIQSPVTTPNNYLVSVSGVAVGSFNITLYNTDSGAGSSHSDAVVLNYAIIRVGS